MTSSTVAFSWERYLSGEDLSRFDQVDLFSRKDSSKHLAFQKQGRLTRSQGITDSHTTDVKKWTSW